MGEAADTEGPRPIWRTPLAAVLVAWMAIVVGATLGSSRLLESLPSNALPFLAVGLYLAPIPFLLIWGFWAMMREPVTGWLAPTLVLAFCGAFVPAFRPLFDAGVDLNFAAHRGAYDAIVAEVTGGGRDPGARGWIEGEQYSVRYGFRADHRDVVQFVWSDSTYLPAAVVYDPKACGPQPAGARPRRRIVTAYDRHLAGHYCYVREFL
jgi:hypothetical protein